MSTFMYARSVVTNRQFFSLWISQIASETAYHLVTFSLVIVLFQITGETIFVTILVLLTSLAPILFSGIAGITADSFDRKRIMMAVHGIRFILGIFLLFLFPFPYIVLPIAFLLSSVAQFFEPSQVASIPALVKEKELFVANSFFSFTRYAMFLVGYMLAGPLLESTSPEIVFTVVAFLYVLAFGSISLVRPLREHLRIGERLFRHDVWESVKKFPLRLKEGIQFMRHDAVVGFLAFQVAFIFAIEKGFISLAPAFSLDWLSLSVSDISWYLILPTGIGTLAGTLVANAVKTKMARNRMVTIGTLIDGSALVLLALFLPLLGVAMGFGIEETLFRFWFVAILAFFSGFADPFVIIPAQTVLQERTPKEKRGRVFGNLVLLMNLLSLIPVVGIGLLSKVLPIATIILILGCLVLLVGVYGYFYWRRFRLEAELKAGA